MNSPKAVSLILLNFNRVIVLKYLDYLEKAEVVSTPTQKAKGNKIMHKPDKIYLGNTNLFNRFNMTGEAGTIKGDLFG